MFFQLGPVLLVLIILSKIIIPLLTQTANTNADTNSQYQSRHKQPIPPCEPSWNVLAMNPGCFVFAVGWIFFMFMLYTVIQDTTVHFITVSLTLWLGYSQLMIKQSLSLLVMWMLITLSGWSRSLLLICKGDHFWLLDFCNLLGYEQFIRCPTYIAGNRLDLAMTDVPDPVDVEYPVVLHCSWMKWSTPLGTPRGVPSGTPLGLLITALSVVCFGLGNLYLVPISEVPSFCSIIPTGTMSAVLVGALLGDQFLSQLIY